LSELVEHANEHDGWSVRRSALVLGIDHVRVLRWLARGSA